MANTNIAQNLIDSKALCALVAYHLHACSPYADYTDFAEVNPATLLSDRITESTELYVTPYDHYANGLLAGFEIGIKAAAAVAGTPLNNHRDDMRAIVAEAIEQILTYRSGNPDYNPHEPAEAETQAAA